MDSTFVMILMGAGLAVALLGMFLVASERELKAKRREIEILMDKFANTPQDGAPTQSTQPEAQHAEIADLRTQNRDLKNQLAALSAELEQSREAVNDLQASQRVDASSEIEKQELRAGHDRLSREVNELRGRLTASETQLQNAVSQNPEQGNARMQTEIDGLKRAINERDAKLDELESARKNLPDLNAIEARHRQERESQQQRITELERQSTMNAEKLTELQTLRDRLTDAEGIHNSLRQEIRRHEEEIPRWQARIAAAEENRRQLAALQVPCNELLSKQAALADRQRQLQEELVSFARLIATAGDGTQQPNAPVQAGSEESLESNTSPQGPATRPTSTGNFSSLRSSDTALELRAVQDPHPEPTENPAPTQTGGRRFGLLGVLLLLAAAGAFGFKLFIADSGRSSSVTATANTMAGVSQAERPAPMMVARTQQPALETPPAPMPARTDTPPVKQAIGESTGTAVGDNRTAKLDRASLGTYQVVRSSRVYAAPNELSRSIGEIEPGVNVNVVNNRDGWLEIHSKHGRPPGFIRREVAAKISGQN
jgi:septal ring factor EnvC (AmiA/AmiB activator)